MSTVVLIRVRYLGRDGIRDKNCSETPIYSFHNQFENPFLNYGTFSRIFAQPLTVLKYRKYRQHYRTRFEIETSAKQL